MTPMPDYPATDEERDWHLWCVRNNVRVSPGGVQGDPDVWTIDVSLDGKTWRKSPSKYSREIIWSEYFKVCKYYYDKYGKN